MVVHGSFRWIYFHKFLGDRSFIILLTFFQHVLHSPLYFIYFWYGLYLYFRIFHCFSCCFIRHRYSILVAIISFCKFVLEIRTYRVKMFYAFILFLDYLSTVVRFYWVLSACVKISYFVTDIYFFEVRDIAPNWNIIGFLT